MKLIDTTLIFVHSRSNLFYEIDQENETEVKQCWHNVSTMLEQRYDDVDWSTIHRDPSLLLNGKLHAREVAVHAVITESQSSLRIQWPTMTLIH